MAEPWVPRRLEDIPTRKSGWALSRRDSIKFPFLNVPAVLGERRSTMDAELNVSSEGWRHWKNRVFNWTSWQVC